tara:strand:+ start:2434 stop:2754 length:321 start_codon:yes stop_codon:yes gene_type:complete
MLGNKLMRQANNLGQKIKRGTRVLGKKSKKSLAGADSELRKVQNSLKNKIIPASMLVPGPSSKIAMGSLQVVNALRGVNSKTKLKNIEKLNARKKLDDYDSSGNFA